MRKRASHRTRGWAVAAVMLLSVWPALADETSLRPFRLCFRDSQTGLALVPDSLLIDEAAITERANSTGKLVLNLSIGEHRLVVRARGYCELVAREQVVGGETPQNILLLDPLASPAVPALAGVTRSEEALVTGYVIDDEGGGRIEGAQVDIAGQSLRTVTDARGYFEICVPVEGAAVPGGTRAERFGTGGLRISKAGYRAQEWLQVVFATGQCTRWQFRLLPGNDTQVFDERQRRGNLLAQLVDGRTPAAVTAAAAELSAPAAVQAAQAAPTSIRVGRNCPTKTTCTTVVTMSIETYTKHVLPAEWFTSWVSDSLKAGAIAIRSYGGWYVYNPLTSTYDICDTTSCQVYGDSTASSTNAAVDATAGIYVVDGSGTIGRAEYSAENNNSGTCGDCYTINNPNDSICLSDPVCCGSTLNGHGRGMCQWGTQRWASTQGKTYDWITDHYYAAYGWTRRNLAGPVITQQPVAQRPCAGGTATFTVAATGTAPLTYRWQKNGANLSDAGHYSGTLTTTLTVHPVDASDVAEYRCVVTDANGSNTSNAASLSLAAPPTVTQDPVAQNGCPGDTFVFTVAATGEGTLAYQWQRDGLNLAEGGCFSGVTTASLTVSGAGAAQLGGYSCVVTASCGTTSSAVAALTLNGPAFAPADFDQDGDVDQQDFGHLQACMCLLEQNDPGCDNATLAGNTCVGSDDVTIFLNCFSGPDQPVDTCCASR